MSREQWIFYLDRLARPLLESAARGELESALAAEHHPQCDSARLRTAPLEAMGRLLSGISPWLALDSLSGSEEALRQELADLSVRALEIQVDPTHRAYLRFKGEEHQTLVDAAFLAQGLLRGMGALWEPLSDTAKAQMVQGMIDLRNRKPGFNNWLLFGAMTEALLHAVGSQPDLMRIDYAIRQHEQWYVGDGTYADGPEFHFDYYNSYVIHPMLTDVLLTMRGVDRAWDSFWELRQGARLTRAAAIQERMIAPDGSFPIVGRSICYRCGAFQTLAQAATLDLLPDEVRRGQVRSALTAVIDRTLGPDASWRDDGFLRIGVVGHQPSLGETYITTGSLYLAACVFLPLGLPPEHPFWTDAESAWTSRQVWENADDIPVDHALRAR